MPFAGRYPIGRVPKIVLIAIKPLCDRGLGKQDPARDQKWLPPLRNLRAKHNLWDTTYSPNGEDSLRNTHRIQMRPILECARRHRNVK
jgi:hypothetical protein